MMMIIIIIGGILHCQHYHKPAVNFFKKLQNQTKVFYKPFLL